MIRREQHRVYVGTDLSGENGAVVDEGRDPVERLLKPKGFESRLHCNEGFHIRLTCNFNGNAELSIVGGARTLRR